MRIAIVIAFLAALLIIPAQIWLFYATKTEVAGVVIKDRERITSVGGKESKYLIFTESETFENTDTILALKFDSSDVYGKLEPGKTCDLVVTGFRIPFMSAYRNILSANCY